MREIKASPESIEKYNLVSLWLKKETDRYYLNMERKIIATGVVKNLYRCIISCTKDRIKPIVALIENNGDFHVVPKERSNMFAQYFHSTLTLDNGEYPYVSYPHNDSLFPNIVIDRSNVALLISRWKISFSKTSDGLPMYFLKEISYAIDIPLIIFFRRSLMTGEIPDFWKFSIVTPILKQTPHNLVANFRPVSIRSFPCRVIEKINGEHGFLKGESRKTAVLQSLNDWTQALEHKKFVDIVYFD